jgi:hypothetical protein
VPHTADRPKEEDRTPIILEEPDIKTSIHVSEFKEDHEDNQSQHLSVLTKPNPGSRNNKAGKTIKSNFIESEIPEEIAGEEN